MLGITKENLVIGAIFTGLALLPFTGYWYSDSYIFTGCSERLDVFFTLECLLILAIAICAVGAINAPKYLINSMGSFAVIVISWLGVGGLLGAHHLFAVVSCWIHFKDNVNYSAKHVVVFILYGLFALIYAVLMGGMGSYNLVSEETSPWKIRRRQENLLDSLRDWRTAHLNNPVSERTSQLFETLIRMIGSKFGGSCPLVVRGQILEHFISVVLFHKYKPNGTWANPWPVNCGICTGIILLGEKHWVTTKPLNFGPVHLDCFLRSDHTEKVVNSLTADVCNKAYEAFRLRNSGNSNA